MPTRRVRTTSARTRARVSAAQVSQDAARTALRDGQRLRVSNRTDIEHYAFQVNGDWGQDGANNAEHARKKVRDYLAAYPGCRAEALYQVVRTYDDDSQWVGPMRPLPMTGDFNV